MKKRRDCSLYLVTGYTGGVGDEAHRPWERVEIEFHGVRMRLDDYLKAVLPDLKTSTPDHRVPVRLTIETRG